MFRFAGFALHPDRAELHGPDGAVIRLRPKAFELLKFFVANSGRALDKQQLMEAVWPGIHVGEDSLFQCIREIRTSLGDSQRQMIKLVTGRGYLFTAAVSIGEENSSLQPPADHEEILNTMPSAGPWRPGRWFDRRGRSAVAVLAAICAIIAALTIVLTQYIFRDAFDARRPVIEVLPIVDSTGQPEGAVLAKGTTAELVNGLAKIDEFHLIALDQLSAPNPGPASRPSTSADFMVRGVLYGGPQSWTFQTHLINARTRKIETLADVTLKGDKSDWQHLESRLAAAAGYALAVRMNALMAIDAPLPAEGSTVAIQQANDSIDQMTRERFATSQTILEKNLAAEPDNVDLQIALAALRLRGIQMSWYDRSESEKTEKEARSLLEQALRSRPNSIPALEAYCRLLTASNQFAESLVACARVLSLNPWDGMALFHLGLTQLQLARFDDALATFEQADRFDVPDVSRWTWLLGAGWADLLIGRNEDAVRWLQRSIAVTPASGRGDMLLAVAYQRLGRSDEARQALARSLQIRPGSASTNISLPALNASPVYLDLRRKINQTLVEIGLPTGAAM